MARQAERTDVQPIPEGYHTLTPHLNVHDAEAALAFYAEAFRAEETFRMDGPKGEVAHAEMRIGDSHFMLADEMEAWGNRSPRTLGGTPTSLMLYVEDADAVFGQAIEAGAEEVMPVQDHFYGDRSGTLEDPFGHRWMVSTHVEDVPPEELERRGEEAMAKM
ncbi:MAG: VOC family protein [Gemmatimonadota bacterium]